MSKLSFRARALDAAKPLPIYRSRDLPDLKDCVSINRAVPQMPTGMEKEEELEHHLQRAISAQQVFREKKENMVIPVPEAESNITYYDRLYKGELKVPKQLIHIQPLGLDNEQPDYDMDSEDETLLNRLNRKMEIKPLQFETMVDRLEKASANQLVSLPEAKLLLNEDDYLLKSVYDYWVRKRKNCRGPSLIPQIKQEKRDGSTNNDAYVAFRRRTEKMQTRKNRKNDEASYEKMLKLRREFSRTVTILEMIKRREKSKRELLHLTLEVVEKRYLLGDFTGEVLNEVTVPLAEKPVYTAPVTLTNGNRHKAELKTKMHKTGLMHQVSIKDEFPFDCVRPKKKYSKRDKLYTQRRPGRPPSQYTVNKADIKQYDFHSSGEEDYTPPLSPPSEPDEENDPDGLFAFRRKAGCQYLSVSVCKLAGMDALRHRHSLTALSLPSRLVGLGRRRMGRGGRVILDRASSGLDVVLKQLDPDAFASPVSRTRDINRVSSATAASSFAEILNNIQSLRWHCFRPRPAQHQVNEGSRMGKPSLDGRVTSSLLLNTKNNGSGGLSFTAGADNQQLVGKTSEIFFTSAQCAKCTLTSYGLHSLLQCSSTGTSRPPHSATLSHSGAGISGRVSSSGIGGPLLPTHSSSSLQSLPNHRNHVSAVSPAHHHHSAQPSAPSPSALKLATVATTLDHVPKVTPASTISNLARENHEPERLLNGISETTMAMEVT
uniref:Enhancer of polycomb homolog n=1 Tax=Myripristis murdjan TaxID=586833 RepID=A0A667Y087_9TELE